MVLTHDLIGKLPFKVQYLRTLYNHLKLCHVLNMESKTNLLNMHSGVPEGKISNIVTAHTDLAPTFLGIAGGAHRSDFDGMAIPLNKKDLKNAIETRQEHVNVEFWGVGLGEGDYGTSIDNDGKMSKSSMKK